MVDKKSRGHINSDLEFKKKACPGDEISSPVFWFNDRSYDCCISDCGHGRCRQLVYDSFHYFASCNSSHFSAVLFHAYESERA